MPYDSPGSLVFVVKNLGEIPTGSRPIGMPNRGGVGSNSDFQPIVVSPSDLRKQSAIPVCSENGF